MHTAEEEFYVFLRFDDGDLSQALIALDHISKTDVEFIRLSLLKDAAVAYCRPFKWSRGSYSKTLTLDESYIPTSYSNLHKELLTARDKVFRPY